MVCLTEVAAIIAVSLNKIPNVIVTIREGAKSIDKSLLQVAYIYKVSKLKKFLFFMFHNFFHILLLQLEEVYFNMENSISC